MQGMFLTHFPCFPVSVGTGMLLLQPVCHNFTVKTKPNVLWICGLTYIGESTIRIRVGRYQPPRLKPVVLAGFNRPGFYYPSGWYWLILADWNSLANNLADYNVLVKQEEKNTFTYIYSFSHWHYNDCFIMQTLSGKYNTQIPNQLWGGWLGVHSCLITLYRIYM